MTTDIKWNKNLIKKENCQKMSLTLLPLTEWLKSVLAIPLKNPSNC